jgi:hypothetical protein
MARGEKALAAAVFHSGSLRRVRTARADGACMGMAVSGSLALQRIGWRVGVSLAWSATSRAGSSP